MTFPSPCGDYGSYRQGFSNEYVGERRVVSVPLRGLWFLSGDENGEYTFCKLSFRPLAGIMVLITAKEEVKRELERRRFRPLAGIMVLILRHRRGRWLRR